MNDLNQCNFIGRVGQDPEVKYIPSGLAVADFSIAVGFKTKTEEKTEWVKIVAWDKLAELVGKYVKKGRQVFVSGRMQTDQWEDKEGVKRYTTKINANTVQFLGSREDTPAGWQEEKDRKVGGYGDAGLPYPNDETVPF